MVNNLKINLGGLVPLSTVDWYGKSAMVIFFRGCQLNCIYCQNHALLSGENYRDMCIIENEIKKASSFISAVVFSGGEPFMQIEALRNLAGFSKKTGLSVGIETNGCYPSRLDDLIGEGLIDKVFLDVKAPINNPAIYANITGKKNSSVLVSVAFDELIKHKRSIELEIRTTVFKSMSERFIEELASSINGYNGIYVLQQGLPENAPDAGIRMEKSLSRSDLMQLGKIAKKFIKHVKIRTREYGEEDVIN